MSNKIKISADSDCESLFIYDATYGFEECCNENGWGSPNLEVSDITSSKLYISSRVMPAEVEIDLTGIFPNDNGLGVEITAKELGLEKIIPAVYKIKRIDRYENTEGEVELLTSSNLYLFYDCIQCCVDKAASSVTMANIDSMESKRALRLVSIFEQMKISADKGLISEADKMAEYINQQCDCCL